ncbi:adenine phosphoribosyltransferase [Sphingobacterium chungjuense]|uniref:adenine phosphoribosyltransferase n=1 Tax=Sphingobacterium chungjuense TaxID=2675553 RepID=UPI001408D7C5|nr:adenine phosphoribosyltransferase [Sphingobacterium chungjuense]
MLEEKLKSLVRDVPNFPQPGIVFKDITPILQHADVCSEVVVEFAERIKHLEFDVIAGIESRGFLFGLMLANHLNKPFVPIRKQGKLPHKTVSESYKLEYGQATIEIHEDAIAPGARVLIHDDLLATGGTVVAASKLIEKVGGEVAGFCFLINLAFLQASGRLDRFSTNVVSLLSYH